MGRGYVPTIVEVDAFEHVDGEKASPTKKLVAVQLITFWTGLRHIRSHVSPPEGRDNPNLVRCALFWAYSDMIYLSSDFQLHDVTSGNVLCQQKGWWDGRRWLRRKCDQNMAVSGLSHRKAEKPAAPFVVPPFPETVHFQQYYIYRLAMRMLVNWWA